MLSIGNITVVDLLCGESLIVVDVGGLGSWLGYVKLDLWRL